MASKAYEQRKERERQRQADQSRSGRDIFDGMPSAKRPKLRAECEKSLKKFCLSVMAEKFKKKFSDDHLKAIDKMERAILQGANFAIAMPRGSGKTTLIIAAVLWAILCGHKRYVSLIGADRDAAKKLLTGLRIELETNDLLLELWPEACWPIRRLEGIAHRCKGQLYKGQRTYIVWTGPQIVFATIPGAQCSGAVIECAGILGRVRGMQYVTPTGQVIRPDCYVVDDPQTNRSARSHTQVAQRLEIITGTLPGLSGPGESISGFACVTVIEENDVAEQLLDRETWPDWQGERFQLVYAWPTAEELWEEYGTILRESLATGKGIGPATEFYRRHRKAMDVGAKVAWAERHLPTELSAIQHAWNLRLKLGDAFWPEYQNHRKPDDAVADLLSIDDIMAKTNGFERGIVPRDANVLTAYIDVQDRMLWWLVLATRSSDFSSWVVDYGSFPKQRSVYFTLRGATSTLQKKYPTAGREGRLRQGLLDLIDSLVTRDWPMPDGKTFLPIAKIGIDAAWGPSTRVVQSVAISSPHRAILLPTFGRGIEAKDRPMEWWQPKPGERKGIGWLIRPAEGGGQYGLLDTNYWKSFLHARLAVSQGDGGSLSLFDGELQTTHRMLAEHMRSEKRSESQTGERTVYVWALPPAKPDNHLMDCGAGALAMASMSGAALAELRTARPAAKKKRRAVTGVF